MDIVKFADAPHYTMPGHEQILARRIQGGEASSANFAVVGHSTIPGGATIPMDVATIGKIYVVTSGEITIQQEDGDCHTLGQMDSIFVPPGEARAVLNKNRDAAEMIVITPQPLGE